jgi:tRNA-dihydrouridine synthase
MSETIQQNDALTYLAPLQGFTDHVYRRAYFEIFQGINNYFIPYVSLKNNGLIAKYEKEILPTNNPQNKIVPQLLVNQPNEMVFLSKMLKDHGYNNLNLNLGCPYPMVTNRNLGAGLLPFPDKIENLLSAFFKNSNQSLSVKLRAGLESTNEIKEIIPVLNQFPLTEVIFHPRIAKQLYDGDIHLSVFEFVAKNLKHKLVYNGDIFSLNDFKVRQNLFPGISAWMLGRGVLKNPFLPSEIKGMFYSPAEKLELLQNFHQRIFELYSEKMDNEGNVLNKMKQFWIYFSAVFSSQHKVLKRIKKVRSITKYTFEVQEIFQAFRLG